MNQRGLSMVELLAATAIFAVIVTAGYILFLAGESLCSVSGANAYMQENTRRIIQRISAELQESDLAQYQGQVVNEHAVVFNDTGVNNSDILRFSVPVCPCGAAAIDSSGDVQYWGAPLVWGQAGCSDNYPVDQNDKVDICHLPPGNPNNPQTLNVNVNAVKSHLAHGDWIGDCNTCDPASYTNRFVEYRLNANNQLVRRILNAGLATIDEKIIADSFIDFQVVPSANSV